MQPFIQLVQALGAPGMALGLALLGAVLWLGRQVLILRRDIGKLRDDVGRSSRDSIKETWELVLEMRAKEGLSADDKYLVESQLLSTIKHHMPRSSLEPRTIRAPIASMNESTNSEVAEDSTKEKSRLTTFLNGLASFGFLGIWSLGWGIGTVSYFVPILLELFPWVTIAFSAGELLSGFGRATLFLLACLAIIGLGVLPAVAAALGAVVALAAMIGSLLPERARSFISLGTSKVRRLMPIISE